MRVLMSGNEAIARGAYEYGVEVATGYPGTPSSEILESVVQYKEIYSEWSVNEKVAMDAAIGASYAGRRAIVTMKQVGMNVASDSFFYAVYTGVRAGLLIVTADDPGMFSSQTSRTTATTLALPRCRCWSRRTARRPRTLWALASPCRKSGIHLSCYGR